MKKFCADEEVEIALLKLFKFARDFWKRTDFFVSLLRAKNEKVTFAMT